MSTRREAVKQGEAGLDGAPARARARRVQLDQQVLERAEARKVVLDGAHLEWYVLGMTKKIAISLPDESLRKAKAAVRTGKAPNLSNYVARLIDDANAVETFSEMIAAWIEESGATEEELRAAEEESRVAFARAGLEPKRVQREKIRRKAG